MKRFKPSFFLLLAVLISSGLSAQQNYNITFRSKLSFPGQTVANMCGWASSDGREYALVGASKGMIIVDVTDPDNPVQIVQVPGPDDFWKEIKTYSHYAYIVSEGGEGVQIVDLSALPSPNVPSKNYRGDGIILNQLNTIHALHIDVTKGFLYAYGSNVFGGGAIVLDLSDPWNPVYAGSFTDLGYIHDGYVDNDTMYAAHINIGVFSIVDMTNKSAPVLLNFQNTPTNFTHNTWLTEDRKTILTTDETANSFLASYDVSDPENIQLLDKMQTNPGSGSIVYNTHIRGNYAITAWYTEGVNIVDVTDPRNLVETGIYDTYPQGSGGSFDGCWGVYPYLPSGNLVASNITPGELWVLTPTYQRACYLEGTITDASSDLPLAGATVKIAGNNTSTRQTPADGTYRTGQATPGLVQVEISKFGYEPLTLSANLTTGEVALLNAALTPSGVYTVGDTVVRDGDNAPVPGAFVSVVSADATYGTVTDANGQFGIPGIVGGIYDVVAGAWGYRYKVQEGVNINSGQQYVLTLEKGYQDDFIFDYGWTVGGTSLTGVWERTDQPLSINVGVEVAPGSDVEGDNGFACYVTGNNSDQIDEDDVENGTSILVSPVMDLSDYLNPRISAKVWCLSANFLQQFTDSIKVYVSNGTVEKLAWQRRGNNFDWNDLEFDVTDFVSLSSTVQIRVVCFDNPAGTVPDTYEAAFDQFNVVDQPLGVKEPDSQTRLQVSPNPFAGTTVATYQHVAEGSRLHIFDAQGRRVHTERLAATSGQLILGENLPNGLYIIRIEQNGELSPAIKIVKTSL